jgi:hypothetical protein
LSTQKLLKILGIQAGIVMLAVFAYLAYDADAVYEWLSGDIVFGAPPVPCDLQTQACEGTLGDGTAVTFAILPRPIPVMEKLQLSVRGDNIPYRTLEVEIYGLNMNMGRYKYTLSPDVNGTYRSEGMIPSCVGEMQWRANIIAEAPTARYGTFFTFTTE